MIKIVVTRNGSGEITGFSVNGHANTAPHGHDIVCAGVAALTQTAVLGIERYLSREISLNIAEGKLVMELSAAPDALTGAVLETMLLGLAEIAQISPNNVRISEHRR
ncbi:MAG: hypothetical protein H6Q74_458 [Firmicutes bacterium]|nr:hypothetical protein [Bacillota bacterium]